MYFSITATRCVYPLVICMMAKCVKLNSLTFVTEMWGIINIFFNIFFFLPAMLFIHLDCFVVTCRGLEIPAVEMSYFSPYNGIKLKCLSQGIITHVLKIFHRPCCKQFHVETVWLCRKKCTPCTKTIRWISSTTGKGKTMYYWFGGELTLLGKSGTPTKSCFICKWYFIN